MDKTTTSRTSSRIVKRIGVVMLLALLFVLGWPINYILWDSIGVIMWPINYVIILFLWREHRRRKRNAT